MNEEQMDAVAKLYVLAKNLIMMLDLAGFDEQVEYGNKHLKEIERVLFPSHDPVLHILSPR